MISKASKNSKNLDMKEKPEGFISPVVSLILALRDVSNLLGGISEIELMMLLFSFCFL